MDTHGWEPKPARVVCGVVPFQQQPVPSHGESNEKGDTTSSSTIDTDEEDAADYSDGYSGTSSWDGGTASGILSGSSTSTKGLKRSELLMEELQRREMIHFEDELHKIILIPRV